MAKVPFSEQVVPSGRPQLGRAELLLQHRGFLSGDQLADLIEASAGQALPPWLSEYLARHLRGKIKRPKGRRPTPKAALDFDLCRANGLYYQALSGYQRLIRERGSAAAKSRHRSRQHDHDNVSASQLAYEHVLRAMRKADRLRASRTGGLCDRDRRGDARDPAAYDLLPGSTALEMASQVSRMVGRRETATQSLSSRRSQTKK
jgi:hypothetical protein